MSLQTAASELNNCAFVGVLSSKILKVQLCFLGTHTGIRSTVLCQSWTGSFEYCREIRGCLVFVPLLTLDALFQTLIA